VKDALCEDDNSKSDDDDDDYSNSSSYRNRNDRNNEFKFIPDIPLPNVSALTLGKVIEFCEHYQQVEVMTPFPPPLKSNQLNELVQPWYVEYVNVDKTILFAIINAANYMNIKPLLDLTCLAVALLIKGKTSAEIRDVFNLHESIHTSNDDNTNDDDEEAQMIQSKEKNDEWMSNPIFSPIATPATITTTCTSVVDNSSTQGTITCESKGTGTTTSIATSSTDTKLFDTINKSCNYTTKNTNKCNNIIKLSSALLLVLLLLILLFVVLFVIQNKRF
jgi:S-phase kinase-associated protein 1